MYFLVLKVTDENSRILIRIR